MQDLIPKSELKVKLILFFIAIVVGIIWMISLEKDVEKKIKYFASLNFTMTGIVKQITTTGDGGYGVVYLKVIKNNKGYDYESKYKGKYLYCKIHDDEAIMAIAGSEEARPGDSIVINTKQSKYLAYRSKVLVPYMGPWLNDQDSFYDYLSKMGYFDFDYYHKNKIPNKKLSVLLF